MEEKYSRRDFLKTGLRAIIGLASAGTISSLLSSCSNKPDKLLFDGEIDGQRVVYFNGDWNSSDRMEIYSDGQLNKIIEDYVKEGVIRDTKSDRYILFLGENKQITYAREFVIDENGVKFQGSDEISKKALEIGHKRLEEATTIYQDLKTKICQKLEQRLK